MERTRLASSSQAHQSVGRFFKASMKMLTASSTSLSLLSTMPYLVSSGGSDAFANWELAEQGQDLHVEREGVELALVVFGREFISKAQQAFQVCSVDVT